MSHPPNNKPSFCGRMLQLFLSSQSLKFLFSSCVAFAIDYCLLLLLHRILPVASLEIGAALAWICSSLTNFFINRNFVFRSDTPLRIALPEYYGLASVVFLLKTYVFLEIAVRVLHIPLAAAKPIAEVVFFLINYLVQKKLIFKKHVQKEKPPQ